MIAADANWPVVGAKLFPMGIAPKIITDLAVQTSDAPAEDSLPGLSVPELLASAEPGQRESIVVEQLQDLIAKTLRLERGRVDADQP